MKTLEFLAAVERAVEIGLAAAAVVDRSGNILAVAGVLTEDEVQLILGTVTHCPSKDVVRRMFCGEIVEVSLDDRTVAVGIAAQFVFVVVVFAAVTKASRTLASALRREVEQLLNETRTDLVGVPPGTSGGGGSSSGPANLPVIEYGLTVPRCERAKG